MKAEIRRQRKMVTRKGLKLIAELQQKRSKRKKINEFEQWFKVELKKLGNAAYNAGASVPSYMNNMDSRMGIGKLYAHALIQAFPRKFERVENMSYDLIFKGKKEDYRISVKSQMEVFQKNLKFGGKGVSQFVIVKNRKNSENTIGNNEWDFMIVIQRQSQENGINFGIAFAPFDIIKIAVDSVKNQVAEVKFRLRDEDWTMLEIDNKFRPEKKTDLNKWYIKREKETHDMLLKMV